jgi:hypothetical protein
MLQPDTSQNLTYSIHCLTFMLHVSIYFHCATKVRSSIWRYWLTGGMSYTMLPAMLPFRKYVWLVLYLFLKILRFFVFQFFLLRPRTSNDWLAYQHWDAYHSLINNMLDAGENPWCKAHVVFNTKLLFASKIIRHTSNKHVAQPPET